MKNLRLLLESLPMFQESMNYYIKELGPYVESFINQQQIDQISNFITNLLSAIGTQILQLGTGVITNVTGFAISTLTTIILSIYFLKDKEILINSVDKGAQALLSPRLLKRMKQLLHDLDVVFGGFLIAQLICSNPSWSILNINFISHSSSICHLSWTCNRSHKCYSIHRANFRSFVRLCPGVILKLKFSHLIINFINHLSTIRCKCYSTKVIK